MASVKDRNASAWLLPAVPGTNHALRTDMARFQDDDEGVGALIRRLGWRHGIVARCCPR